MVLYVVSEMQSIDASNRREYGRSVWTLAHGWNNDPSETEKGNRGPSRQQ